MSGTRSFVDTNVFVYATDESPQEKDKHAVASRVIAADPDNLVISAAWPCHYLTSVM